jgi:gas vesicle protein
MSKVASLFIGAILGGMVGSALALLLAPMSGNDLRSEVDHYARQISQEVEQAAATRRAELERELANLRGEVITQ